MRSEREKMLAGELYDPLDPELVAAGSVVTRDIPEGVFAAGNPCRVIRQMGTHPFSAGKS